VDPKTFKFNTKTLHSGYQPEKNAGSRAVPIYQTTSYMFEDTDSAAALYNLEKGGHVYTRLTNPTVAVLEERVAALEGGTGAVATASGMSAIFLTLMTMLEKGDHIVASSSLYGGTSNLLRFTLPKFGINTTFVKQRNTVEYKKAIQINTKCILGEILSNPVNELMNLPAVAKIAHDAGIPLIVDSTYQTPYLCRPFDHGADLVVHSLTKWMGGHGTSMGGVLIEGGKFNWEQNDKFPSMTKPYEGYHGLSFTEEFGPAAFSMKARAEGMHNFGPTMSPTNAFNILQGIETLSLRMDKHCLNANLMVEFLSTHESVSWISHPNAADYPDKELANKILPGGKGSMIAFGIKGGKRAGEVFLNSVQLASHLANVGDSRTLVIHPASTTHSQMDEKMLELTGITQDLVRLSVGLEDIEDLKNDFNNAFRITKKTIK
jgi:O-acetylhomoserine (thiol)-lyase